MFRKREREFLWEGKKDHRTPLPRCGAQIRIRVRRNFAPLR